MSESKEKPSEGHAGLYRNRLEPLTQIRRLKDQIEILLKAADKSNMNPESRLRIILDLLPQDRVAVQAMRAEDLQQIVEDFEEYWDGVEATVKIKLLENREIQTKWVDTIEYLRKVLSAKQLQKK